MAFHAQQDDVGVASFTAKPLVKTVTAGVFPRASRSLDVARTIKMVKLQSVAVISPTPVARPSVHVEGVLPQLAAVVCAVGGAGVVVGASLLETLLAQMLIVGRLILAISTRPVLPALVVGSKGLL
jgi:hypothetical protein